jgi:hypothetical protein
MWKCVIVVFEIIRERYLHGRFSIGAVGGCRWRRGAPRADARHAARAHVNGRRQWVCRRRVDIGTCGRTTTLHSPGNRLGGGLDWFDLI